jgi:glucose dehydrogenase
MTRRAWFLAVLVTASLAAAKELPSRQVEWLFYGGDPGGMKYSALTDVNAANVQRL